MSTRPRARRGTCNPKGDFHHAKRKSFPVRRAVPRPQGFEAAIGGQTSLDIFMKGRNKSQVYNTIGTPMVFFGDRCETTGNDFPLVQMLKPTDTFYHVTGPEETFTLLKEKYSG